MEILLVLGLFLLTHQGLAQNLVLTVNPPQLEAKREEAIELDCQGNTRDLQLYISNRVNWKHVANDGTSHKITTGFYLDTDADKTRYAITHGPAENSDANYSFRLKILSVTDNDDGKYVCENEDNKGIIFSSKEVRFTVLNPVVKVELHMESISGHDVHFLTQTMPNNKVHEVEAGDYKVTCTAEGSNPNPQMILKFDNDAQTVDTTTEKSFVGNMPSYKGMFTKEFSLSVDKTDVHTIKCSAGLPGRQFPEKYAGLIFTVFSVPEIECDNVSALVKYRRTELTCRINSVRSLDCNHINWADGFNNFIIYPGKKTKDPSYGTVMANCKVDSYENGRTTLTTTLTIEEVHDIHFDTVFYVEYSHGNNKHRQHVQLYMKGFSEDEHDNIALRSVGSDIELSSLSDLSEIKTVPDDEDSGTNSQHGNSGTEPSERAIFIVMLCAVISVLCE